MIKGLEEFKSKHEGSPYHITECQRDITQSAELSKEQEEFLLQREVDVTPKGENEEMMHQTITVVTVWVVMWCIKT